jgi:hypothetical protein
LTCRPSRSNRFTAALAALLTALALAASGAAARDLSGVWQTRITGGLIGESVLCQMVPELDRTQVDTVLTAHSLKELMRAIIPDTSRTWFDSVCEPTFHGAAGDSLTGHCRIPATYAKPCGLVGDLTFHGSLHGDGQFIGMGTGDVTLGGPGLCPKTGCPGELHIVARRIGPVPKRGAPAAPAPTTSPR